MSLRKIRGLQHNSPLKYVPFHCETLQIRRLFCLKHPKNEKGVSAAVFCNFSGSFSPSSGLATFAFRTFVSITSTRFRHCSFHRSFRRSFSSPITSVRLVTITSARSPRSPSSPLLSPLLPTLLFFADHLRTFGHDHLRTSATITFVTALFDAPFDVPFLRPEPPQRKNKLTNFASSPTSSSTDIKQHRHQAALTSSSWCKNTPSLPPG
jgi:hypothetical protein